jgi:hypothetical protein
VQVPWAKLGLYFLHRAQLMEIGFLSCPREGWFDEAPFLTALC